MSQIELEFRENKNKLEKTSQKNDELEIRNRKLLERQEKLVKEVGNMSIELGDVKEVNFRYESTLEDFKQKVNKLEKELENREGKIRELVDKVSVIDAICSVK